MLDYPNSPGPMVKNTTSHSAGEPWHKAIHNLIRSRTWWRWGESNPRPKRLWPNIYACSPPLISHPVRRRTGLSGRNRSVIRGPSARTERPRASPARLCRCGLAGVRRATSGPLIRPRERNRCSQLQFFPFFNEANENPRRAIWSPHIPSKPDHPQVPLRKTAYIILFFSCKVKTADENSAYLAPRCGQFWHFPARHRLWRRNRGRHVRRTAIRLRDCASIRETPSAR